MASRGQVYRRRDRSGWYARFRVRGRYVNRGGFLSSEAAADWLHAERLRLEREELLGVPQVRGSMTRATATAPAGSGRSAHGLRAHAVLPRV
jgi:hypothetical protein